MSDPDRAARRAIEDWTGHRRQIGVLLALGFAGIIGGFLSLAWFIGVCLREPSPREPAAPPPPPGRPKLERPITREEIADRYQP